MMDTKSLVQWGVAAIGGVMAVCVAMLGLIAWAHDGEVANTIIAQLINVLLWGMPTLAILLGINQGASALVAVKQASASAQVQTAQATATAQVQTAQATAQPAPVVAAPTSDTPATTPAAAVVGSAL